MYSFDEFRATHSEPTWTLRMDGGTEWQICRDNFVS